MTGQKNTLSSLIEKDSPQKVLLGVDYQYPIKGMGEATYKLDSGTPMRMKDVLFVPGYHHIKISRDVTFDEDAALKKSRRCQLEEEYEEQHVAPRVAESMRKVITSPDEEILEDHDIIESQEPPQMTISHKRKPTWARELIQDGEKYGAPEGTMRQVKKRKPFSSYMALMCDLLEKEPTYFEEAIQKKEWADAMTEEYQSIIKNDVWEIVPRTKNKDVVSSKWLYKIKHAADGSIEKHKARFVTRGFS
jgi:hypothetical protein